MRDFRTLRVWEKARAFAFDIYRETRALPSDERFGLTSQMRRAAVSIASNIAEGCGRDGERELARYLTIASGSACEVECQILLAGDLEFLSKETCEALDAQVSEIKKMLVVFVQRLTANG